MGSHSFGVGRCLLEEFLCFYALWIEFLSFGLCTDHGMVVALCDGLIGGMECQRGFLWSLCEVIVYDEFGFVGWY